MSGSKSISILDVLKKAEDFLARKGCASPRLDAQVLLAHVLSCDRVSLYVDYAKPLGTRELDAYRELIKRRAKLEPVAYLVGTREFWSLGFHVDSRVLIPRPDSETLIEEALALFDQRQPLCFADLGTGSGCLAAALATEFPMAQGLAIDCSRDSLQVAEANLGRLGLSDRVCVQAGNLASGLFDHGFDLLVANLPYIPSGDVLGLDSDVRCFEPLGALDGGQDGLDFIRQVVLDGHLKLKDEAWLLLEVGCGQAPQVVQLCHDAGYVQVHTRKDLASLERVVAAQCGKNDTDSAPI
jgi:release factor glutamine methyltransferase